MKRFKIYDLRFTICGRAAFPKLEKAGRTFVQAVEQTALSVSKLWETLHNSGWSQARPLPACPAGADVLWLQDLAGELFHLRHEAAGGTQQNSLGEFCFCKISTTTIRQSAIFNRKFF